MLIHHKFEHLFYDARACKVHAFQMDHHDQQNLSDNVQFHDYLGTELDHVQGILDLVC